ncbi:MAG: tetratricopeptide repeat protein [Bryobacteraceae bacterium]|jgi:tetratricopeptide (TPR) repeat protein
MRYSLRILTPAALALTVAPAPYAWSQANVGGIGSGTATITGSAPSSDVGHPVTVIGNVMMDDGSPVPANVEIQRICSGTVHSVAYTDTKGHFRFQWGKTTSLVLTDASEAGSGSKHSSGGGFGGFGSAGGSNPMSSDPFGNRMINCQLRADLAGYRSDKVNMMSGGNPESIDVGSIVLHRLAGVEGNSISQTSLMAPKDATKAYEKGLQLLLKEKPDEAAKEFEKAVALYPKYADAWTALGKLRVQQNSYGPAKEAFIKAADADPKLVTPCLQLGLLAARDQKWEDSARYLDRAVKLDPIEYPQAWYADAVAHYNLARYDAAEVSVREAIKLDPRHVNPRADYLLGMVLVAKKQYAEGAAELKTFLNLSPDAPDFNTVKQQLAILEDALRELQKEAGKQADPGPVASPQKNP